MVAVKRQSLARTHLATHRIIGDANAPHLCVVLRGNWKSAQLGYVATTRGLKVSPGITYAADNATESAFEFVRLSLMSEPDEQRLISAFARFDALASASPTAFLDSC
jgi:DNA-binding transcriptional MocR family regulator